MAAGMWTRAEIWFLDAYAYVVVGLILLIGLALVLAYLRDCWSEQEPPAALPSGQRPPLRIVRNDRPFDWARDDARLLQFPKQSSTAPPCATPRQRAGGLPVETGAE